MKSSSCGKNLWFWQWMHTNPKDPSGGRFLRFCLVRSNSVILQSLKFCREMNNFAERCGCSSGPTKGSSSSITIDSSSCCENSKWSWWFSSISSVVRGSDLNLILVVLVSAFDLHQSRPQTSSLVGNLSIGLLFCLLLVVLRGSDLNLIFAVSVLDLYHSCPQISDSLCKSSIGLLSCVLLFVLGGWQFSKHPWEWLEPDLCGFGFGFVSLVPSNQWLAL